MLILVFLLGMVEKQPVPIKLVLKGYEDRANDVLYAPSTLISNDPRTMVIYFGGDIQVFFEHLLKNVNVCSQLSLFLSSPTYL